MPQLKEKERAGAAAYHAANSLREELEEEEVKLARLQTQVAARLQRLVGRSPEAAEWEREIQRLRAVRRQLQEQVRERELKLARLAVTESHYRAAQATIAYDRENLEAAEAELEAVQETLREKTEALNNLKQRIASTTGNEHALDWKILIQNLQREREDCAAEYRTLTAKIVAGILVNEQVDVIRNQEEGKIREKLASAAVTAPIRRITGRYAGVHYDKGHLWATDAYGQFPLSELSTGAREQVLLALRLGFANHVLGRQRLFLLLDDAFQHADWQRRERLVAQMVALAQDGWQIIYFSMDDHIRELFNAAGREHFPAQYRYYELDAGLGFAY